MGGPGRVQYMLSSIRVKDRNNGRHGDPEHVKFPVGGDNLYTCRVKEITYLATHPHTLTVHIIRGMIQLEGERGLFHVLYQG